MEQTALIQTLLDWYDRNRRSLPFRGTHDPYHIWVSEIMLQQTRTETVAAYYLRFIERFPTVAALAQAPEEEVLKLWEGLGYYSRARNLHRGAKQIAAAGVLPRTAGEWLVVPGVGPYTAAAIASIAFDEPVPAIDGNLIRVLARLFYVTEIVTIPGVRRQLQSLGQALMPARRAGDVNQALMDLGASICVPGTPDCGRCPLSSFCRSLQHGNPEQLPQLPQKKAPAVIPVGVGIVICKDRVLLIRRSQTLLHGLYVFSLIEGDDSAAALQEQLRQDGMDTRLGAHLGRARHVFTHRIWQMQLYHLYADHMPPVKNGIWASQQEMLALPLPTAMKAAKAQALSILDKNPSDKTDGPGESRGLY